MIHFSNVTFRYGMSSRGDVLSNVSLHLKPGFIYGLLGKNGVGKSTLIRLISGLNPASQGSVRTLGQKPQLRLPSMLQEIFIIPEEMTFPPITPAKYGEIYGTFYPRFNAGDMMKYLDTLQVDPRQTMSTMSQGQRKKAYMAFGLAAHTKIMLMDEPTNGLDIPSKRLFRKILDDEPRDNRLILISTHQVRDLEQLIDAVIILNDSAVLLNETSQTLLDTFYFGPVDKKDENVIYAEDSGRTRYGVKLKPKSGIHVPRENPSPGEDEQDLQHDGLDLELLFNATLYETKKIQHHLPQSDLGA